MSALRDAASLRFSERLASQLVKASPGIDGGDRAGFVATVRARVLDAQELGFRIEKHVALFTVAALLYPREMAANRAVITALLRDQARTATERYDALAALVEPWFDSSR